LEFLRSREKPGNSCALRAAGVAEPLLKDLRIPHQKVGMLRTSRLVAAPPFPQDFSSSAPAWDLRPDPEGQSLILAPGGAD
jgi:hypothetical protein